MRIGRLLATHPAGPENSDGWRLAGVDFPEKSRSGPLAW